MSNASNYPSCIKIPSTISKQDITADGKFFPKIDLKETETLYNELVLIADRTFGERKWSHVVTNQTIDFTESYMGKYVCGCVTFLKIQLPDGVFHEDMGYCHTEATMKSVSMHCARIGSQVDAFKKVLSCFGKEIGHEIQKLSKKSKSDKIRYQTQDLEYLEVLEPCAQSTPQENNKEKGPKVNVTRQKSPNIIPKEPKDVQPTVTKQETHKTVSKLGTIELNDVFQRLAQCQTDYQRKQNNGQTEQDSKKVLTEEELLRLERKRKQMEKQAEYKRLMLEKEKQKLNKP